MKILITGHKGFIGSHVYERLSKNHEVIGADIKGDPKIDIKRYGPLHSLAGDVDLIVHLAASCSTPRSISNPRSDFVSNVVGTFNVLELARSIGAKVLYTSSVKAFKGSPYGVSKGVGELYLWEYIDIYGLEGIINRPGTVYGPGQDGSEESGWLTWFLKASKENLPITIYGDGEQRRDVLYITDYVDLLEKQIDEWDEYKNQGYNVGGGTKNALTLNEAVRMLKIKDVTYMDKRKGDVKTFVSMNDGLRWSPKVGYKEGIKLTKEAL